MKTVKDRFVVVSADFAGFPLKEAVKEHLIKRGWTVEDLTPVAAEVPMFHRAGFLVGAKIAEREYERGLVFCGTGMGIHIAASKCPHVQAAVCESLAAAARASRANNCNVLSMGAFFVGPQLGKAMADAFLAGTFGEAYDEWEGFEEFHRIAYEEIDSFDYETYKANGFKVVNPREASMGVQPVTIPW